MTEYLILSIVLGTLIGWSTNVLAVKLIFRPYKPINILGLFFIQGLIPKRRDELALVIGNTVEEELLSGKEILEYLSSSELQDKMISKIIITVKQKMNNLIPGFIPSSLKDYFINSLDSIIEDEVKKFFVTDLPELTEDLKDFISISAIIEGKINKLDLVEVEEMIIKIARKELKHIEYLGGVLGFFIGLIQGLIYTLLT